MKYTDRAMSLIAKERERQLRLWGDQINNHPFEWVSILGEEYGELCQAINETFFTAPQHPERGGIANIEREAVQIAAVAIQIIEVMERQKESEWRRGIFFNETT